MDDHQYQSPFSWRYGSQEMRALWSERQKRRTWRMLWCVLAEVQQEFGLVSQEQVDDLRASMEKVNLERSLQIEAEVQHDVMAEVQAYAEQCPVGGGIIHLGMTSMDIVDNGDVLRIRAALDLLIQELKTTLRTLSGLIEQYADKVLMAYTHLQPAEPTTLGYRLAFYGQDLLVDLENLERIRASIKGKGMRGAVGTAASYQVLLGAGNLARFEQRLSEKLGIGFYPVTSQTYPRKQDYDLLSALAGLGASMYKFAFDLRILQSPGFGELSEPFGEKQVGSSAMPFKQNPIHAEKLNSLGRQLAQFPRLAWDNAAHSLLERTLDDSANRRTSLPEAFLIADEMLKVTSRILRGLKVQENQIQQNVEKFGPFAATERVLMELSKAGANRQEMHARLREHSLAAWEAIRKGIPNPLPSLVESDPVFLRYLSPETIHSLLDVAQYLGDAPARARSLADLIRQHLAES